MLLPLLPLLLLLGVAVNVDVAVGDVMSIGH